MEEIVKLTIKGSSYYAPVDEAYEDKLIITPSSISYEYKPHPEYKSETNIYRKWSYKTTSPVFDELYKIVMEMTPSYLNYEFGNPLWEDVGSITITATFKDKHKKTAEYSCPGDFFSPYFKVIKEMVPTCEYVPAVLLTIDDYLDEEE
ncbi:MAG: hypothetical protein MSS69_10855 [Spirochaetales bacterium]|nr:hypothetical protein [Spirochaetales bacterium]